MVSSRFRYYNCVLFIFNLVNDQSADEEWRDNVTEIANVVIDFAKTINLEYLEENILGSTG